MDELSISSMFVIRPHYNAQVARDRYLRLSIDLPNISRSRRDQRVQDRNFPNDLEFKEVAIGETKSTLATANQCIYCGAFTKNLESSQECTEEHIIPESIGGKIVIKHASCDSCANLIQSYESYLSSKLFWIPKNKLGIVGKNKKRRKSAFLIRYLVDGVEHEQSLPLDINPAFLTLPIYRSPELIQLNDGFPFGPVGLWIYRFNDCEHLIKSGITRAFSPWVDTLRFAQLLAKIAYGYAVSVSGFSINVGERIFQIEDYDVVILPLIVHKYGVQERPTGYLNYVGCFNGSFPKARSLHQLTLTTLHYGGFVYLTVLVRLFADLGSPVYWVVVGQRPRDSLRDVLPDSA